MAVWSSRRVGINEEDAQPTTPTLVRSWRGASDSVARTEPDAISWIGNFGEELQSYWWLLNDEISMQRKTACPLRHLWYLKPLIYYGHGIHHYNRYLSESIALILYRKCRSVIRIKRIYIMVEDRGFNKHSYKRRNFLSGHSIRRFIGWAVLSPFHYFFQRS